MSSLPGDLLCSLPRSFLTTSVGRRQQLGHGPSPRAGCGWTARFRSETPHQLWGFHYMVGDRQPEEAVRHLRQSLELRHEWGDPPWVPSGTLALGWAELAAGRRKEGTKLIRRAASAARDAGLSERRIREAEDWLRRAQAGETPFA